MYGQTISQCAGSSARVIRCSVEVTKKNHLLCFDCPSVDDTQFAKQ